MDTLRIGLLGFSLISLIIIAYPISYFAVHSATSYQELLPGVPASEISIMRNVRILSIFMFILPQIISLLLWYVMPSFVRRWYSLEALPPRYTYVYDIVKKIASRMGVQPPAVLYTQKNVANCFNLGKRESESTIVISNWLVTRLHSEELEAVLAHEIAHTKNRDVTLMAYFSAARWIILFSPLFAICGLIYFSFQSSKSPIGYLYDPWFWSLIIPFLLVYISLILGIQWFSRLREITADAQASLFVDKNILKRILYKLACARATQMALVSPCLMMSSAHGFGGILSTHPPVYKRYLMLDKKKYIIDTGEPPSFRFCFTSAVSIFIFTQLVILIFSTLYVSSTKQMPQDMPFIFISPIITAFILVLYYEYIPWKYLGFIVLLIAFLKVMILSMSALFFSFIVQRFLLPLIEVFPPENKLVVESVVMQGGNLSETAIDLLEHEAQFFIITFLIMISLKYAKKYIAY